MTTGSPADCLYMFLDEGGDLGFTPRGSRYFTLTAVTATRPFPWLMPLDAYKYELLEWGRDIQCFHAAYDNRHIRQHVLDIIASLGANVHVHSIIVDKRKTPPPIQQERRFYPRMLGHLVRATIDAEHGASYKKVIAITDTIPLKGKLNAMTKAVKETLSDMLPRSMRYEVMHHASLSNLGLQVADYCNWAVGRKWESGDASAFSRIRRLVRSEIDHYSTRTRLFY